MWGFRRRRYHEMAWRGESCCQVSDILHMAAGQGLIVCQTFVHKNQKSPCFRNFWSAQNGAKPEPFRFVFAPQDADNRT